MFALGLPISQGALSTILGVLGLYLSPSYIFVTFFKMVFLVIVLGALHGLFLLPVLLSLFGPSFCKNSNHGSRHQTEGPDEKWSKFGRNGNISSAESSADLSRSSCRNVASHGSLVAVTAGGALNNQASTTDGLRHMRKHTEAAVNMRIPRPSTKTSSPLPSGNISEVVDLPGSGRESRKGGSENKGCTDLNNV